MKRIGVAKLEKDAGWVIRKLTYLIFSVEFC